MKIENKVIVKDIVYNLQAYLHWFDEFNSENEWTASKNADTFLQRLRELLPQALEMLKTEDFDYRCG